MAISYRPWGPVEWTLSLSKPRDWHFIGVIGTEERSLCARNLLQSMSLLYSESFALIQDVKSDRHTATAENLISQRLEKFLGQRGDSTSIEKFSIMAELYLIQNFAKKAISSGQPLILDITSLPKRFFFPMLRSFMRTDSVRDLVLTYTSPQSYADDAPLYEEIEPWKHLPGFIGDEVDSSLWIVSVGFLVESLRKYLGDNPDHERMKVLIPFPAPLSILRRTWVSVFQLEEGQQDGRFEKHRVDTLDISAAFDRIVSLTRNSSKPVAFAPFGPKPTSAAMCLYAIEQNSAVYYPQPTVYNPNYSIGIRNNDPETAVKAYWIKHDGENLYCM
jgi:hypothetical protein